MILDLKDFLHMIVMIVYFNLFHITYCFQKNDLPPVRLELTAFRL